MRVQTLAVFAVIAATASSAATPPALIHYQGVLRDAADRPLTGSFDVVFRLYDAPSGGAEVLIDSHLAASGQAIQVTGGLFAVPVGGGHVVDGSGPGAYGSLGDAFRDYASLWLEV